MKKLTCALAALMAINAAMAEGYQVNSLSARQGGMAHTGVAQHLGAESMYFNPAGLGFMNSTFELSGSFNAVLSNAKATVNGTEYKTDNAPSTPFMVNAAFSIYDNFKAGINLYVPYGSGIDWGTSWPGATLSQSVSLKAFTVQPTFSWRPIKNLSIGAGLMISWGNVDLNKGLINPSSMDMLLSLMKMGGQLPAETPMFNGTQPASVNLVGKSDVSLGANIGVMWDINDQWTVGANYRTKSVLKVGKGDASVNYINSLAETLLNDKIGLLNNANFAAEMPMPSVLTFGASYKPSSKLLLALDMQMTGWSAYKSLDIDFDLPSPAFNQHLAKNYKDAWAFRLGAQYAVTNRLDVRAGCIVDLTPVNKSYYNPETPGMTKVEPSVGLSFRPTQHVSIDLSLLYVAGMGADNATCTTTDMLAPTVNALIPPAAGLPQLPVNPVFSANYKVNAIVPSIGISYTL